MARRRFQDPKPQRLGQWWYLLTWQDEFVDGRRIRKRKRIKLALATMPEREVRKIAAEMLRPLNQGLISVGSGTKFEEFVGRGREAQHELAPKAQRLRPRRRLGDVQMSVYLAR